MNKSGLAFLLPVLMLLQANAQEGVPQFRDYAVRQVYDGKNHPLVMDAFARTYKSRLTEAIRTEKPTFAGHFLVTGWGCGSGGCNAGAIIDAVTGRAYPFPVVLSSVYPLKPEFEKEDGQEHIYKLDSRLMIFAGDLGEMGGECGDDIICFYEFADGKFKLLKSMSYGRKGKERLESSGP